MYGYQVDYRELCIGGDHLWTPLLIAENVRLCRTLPIPLIFQVESHPCQTKQHWDFRQRSYRRSEGLFRIDTINGYSDRNGKFL
jgi:hypothetical protein